MKIKNRTKLNQPVEFVLNLLADYDTSNIERISIGHSKNGVSGLCTYPNKSKGIGYIINARVLEIYHKYPITQLHWARIPSKNLKQGWSSGSKLFIYYTKEHAIVHILAHEIFHFLSHSRQIKECGEHVKNVEANANWWADIVLDLYIQTEKYSGKKQQVLYALENLKTIEEIQTFIEIYMKHHSFDQKRKIEMLLDMINEYYQRGEFKDEMKIWWKILIEK